MNVEMSDVCIALLPHLQDPQSFYESLGTILSERMEPEPFYLYRPDPPDIIGFADSPDIQSVHLQDELPETSEIELNALLYREKGLGNDSHKLTHLKTDNNWFGSVEHLEQTNDWFETNVSRLTALGKQLRSCTRDRNYSELGQCIETIRGLVESNDSHDELVDEMLAFTGENLEADEVGYYSVSHDYYTLESNIGFNKDEREDRQFFSREQLRQLELNQSQYLLESNEETETKNLLLPLSLGTNHGGLLILFNYIGFDENLNKQITETVEAFRSLLAIALGASRSTYREEEGFIVDQLTSLKTEQYYQNRLDQEIERGNRYDSKFSVLILEIDNLDGIQETHGDTAQLEILRELAHLIENTFRMVDVACRFEDNQFGIIYPNTSIEGALTAAQRFDKLVEDLTLSIGESKISITVHGGLASYPEDGEAANELLKQARLALYEAKHSEKATLQSSQELDHNSTENN